MTKEDVQRKIDVVRGEIERLQEEERSLKKELRKIIVDENTQLLLGEVYEADSNNSMYVRLHEGTRTTPIMDQFYNSDKRFLIFDRIFSVGENWTRVSLVVTKGRRDVHMIDSKLTMTDLKKHAGMTVSKTYLETHSKTSRFYSLAQEMLTASSKLKADRSKVSFETPIRLGGQIYANQTGYGSTYEGTFQVSQGTLYGETTGFNVIGIIKS